MLRELLDRFEPLFQKGGKLEKLYPLYEANDTFLFTPDEVTDRVTHVRDALDSKRMMSLVIVALIPCIFMAMYNTGYQANKIIEQTYAASAGDELTGLTGWRYSLMNLLQLNYTQAGSFYANFAPANWGTLLACVLHGALYFLPLYIVTMAAGGACEVLFAVVRRHEVNEGFLVTGMLYPLTLPPDLPFWQCALGIIFGVVVGKEIFGGTGRNFLNPALTGRAFLYFAYATEMTGDRVWSAVDGHAGATALGAIAADKDGAGIATIAQQLTGNVTYADGAVSQAFSSGQISWWDAFFGNMHGSMGETSALACLIGAAILIVTRIGSWKTMVSVVLGMTVFSTFLWLLPVKPAVYNIPPWWHLVLGGFAFGTVFMATDPVSSAMTETGKWIYGALIGVMCVLVRSLNPAFPEGIMLAILFGNVMAPLIDYFVIQTNIRRRLARSGSP